MRDPFAWVGIFHVFGFDCLHKLPSIPHRLASRSRLPEFMQRLSHELLDCHYPFPPLAQRLASETVGSGHPLRSASDTVAMDVDRVLPPGARCPRRGEHVSVGRRLWARMIRCHGHRPGRNDRIFLAGRLGAGRAAAAPHSACLSSRPISTSSISSPRCVRRRRALAHGAHLHPASSSCSSRASGSYLSAYIAEQGVSVSIRAPPQAHPGWSSTVLEKPHIRDAAKPGKIICYDPATAYLIGEVDADTREDDRAKIARAKQAQVAWASSSFAVRRKLMRTMQRWVVRDAETITRVAARDTGKTAIDAAFGELLTTCSKLAWTIGNGERVLQTETRPNNLLLMHKVCEVRHEPMGVVGACVSWNYSAHNVLGPIIASLFAGNAIVVKASELVAWSAHYFVDAVRECLRASGCDPELVQLVTCFPEEAEALTQSADMPISPSSAPSMSVDSWRRRPPRSLLQ
ncbi:hypothetical protein L1887_51707 [Cichorium endivia]|nr:hypothetical protein L1887_51707 [Cichorium endivia]